MAIITNSTFDPLKARCNVRLQQGVPIVDADWNELDDIRKFELRAYLKWYVGDGIPDASDGFRIDATAVASATDIVIRAGVPAAPPGTTNLVAGLQNTGRCIVDGLDVIIGADVNFTAQALFGAPGPGGAPQIQPIPVIAGTVAIVLDVSERLVTAQEDPGLVLSGLGTESCARLKREWAVRARTGTTAPAPGDADWLAGHSYLLLATIARKLVSPGVPAPIAQADITDARHRGLSTAALENRLGRLERLLLLPAFGTPGSQIVPGAGTVGQVVQLRGRNFDVGNAVVTFGNIPAALSGTPTSSTLSVTVPNLANGTYSVSISTDGGGPVQAADHFIVLGGGGGGGGGLAPTLAAGNPIVPLSGVANQPILINGTNFSQPGLAVAFGANAASILSFTDVQINVEVPPLIPGGAYTITVSTNAGSVASANTFFKL